LILNISKFDHISAVMRDTLHWLPVQDRIEYKLCFITRNSLAGVAPVYINDLCIPVHTEVGRQHLRSAARGDLVVPRFRLSRYGRRGFYVAGPSLWNSLPTSVRQLVDKPLAFKRHLKTFLFQRQSSQHSWGFISQGALYKCPILLPVMGNWHFLHQLIRIRIKMLSSLELALELEFYKN